MSSTSRPGGRIFPYAHSKQRLPGSVPCRSSLCGGSVLGRDIERPVSCLVPNPFIRSELGLFVIKVGVYPVDLTPRHLLSREDRDLDAPLIFA
jgi:hypothetical protein